MALTVDELTRGQFGGWVLNVESGIVHIADYNRRTLCGIDYSGGFPFVELTGPTNTREVCALCRKEKEGA
mgnify:CR=1 FL=1